MTPAPDFTVGCLGGGQLARMMALAGRRMNIAVRVFDPDPDACAQHVAEHVCAAWDDAGALERFLDGLDVVTYEFESIPADLCARIEKRALVRPGSLSLRTCQDRLLEKELFERHGIDVHPWRAVENEAQLGAAIGAVGLPAVLKRRTGGYDGKGQRVIREEHEAMGAWEELGRAPCLLEAFVPFERELSLVGARSLAGETAFYPLVENRHASGILRATIAPAIGVPEGVDRAARAHARDLLEGLGHVGVFTIEFFEHGGALLANECAPRVHN
jgi:5-(carboxyamino)imidazole ribonucleotide synthase